MKIVNNALFPVPVTFVEGVINQQQLKDIFDYTLQKNVVSTVHPSIVGNGTSFHHAHTDYIAEIASKLVSCTDLPDILKRVVEEYSDYSGLAFTAFTNSWFNIQDEGSLLKRHTHAGSVISGALYINVDEKSSPLIFDNPNPIPYHINQSKDTIFTNTEHFFNPLPGDLIIFPSILAHHSGLFPNKTKNRTVISFNAS